MSQRSVDHRELLLGEWACLGILAEAPAHGFAVAARLKPDGDVGRVWSMSRALTYRALDQLRSYDLVRAVGEEPGLAGGSRTILAPTRRGATQLRAWLGRPVLHLRDLRSELLLKLILASACAVDTGPLLARQRVEIERIAASLHRRTDGTTDDVVDLWRLEATDAAERFLDRVAPAATTAPTVR